MQTFSDYVKTQPVNKQPTWQFIGMQDGINGKDDAYELFNNLIPVGRYTRPEFTVGRKTVERLGFVIPPGLKVGDTF